MSKAQRRWSSDEDAILREEMRLQTAAHGDDKNWNEIAKKLPGRTNKDCRKRFYNVVTGGLKKGPWTEEEDTLLESFVKQHGFSWAAISRTMKTRSADQCSKRWHHCLDPRLDHSSWTDQENHLLLNAVKTHGTSWKGLQTLHFPDRSANNVKNQYILIKRKPIELAPDAPPCCSVDVSLPDIEQSPGYDSDTVEGHAVEIDGPLWQEFSHLDTLPNAYEGFDAEFPYLDPSTALHSSFPFSPLPSNNPSTSQALDSDLSMAPTANRLLSSRQQLQCINPARPEDRSAAQALAIPRSRPGQSPESAAIRELSEQQNGGGISSHMRNGRRTTITLEDADSNTLVAVMDILLKSNATVKFETQS